MDFNEIKNYAKWNLLIHLGVITLWLFLILIESATTHGTVHTPPSDDDIGWVLLPLLAIILFGYAMASFSLNFIFGIQLIKRSKIRYLNLLTAGLGYLGASMAYIGLFLKVGLVAFFALYSLQLISDIIILITVYGYPSFHTITKKMKSFFTYEKS